MSIREKLCEHQELRAVLNEEREKRQQEKDKQFYRLMWGVLITIWTMFFAEIAFLIWLVLRKG